MFTILDHLSLAHNRICQNRTTLQCALDQANKKRSPPILLIAIHNALVTNNNLAALLDPIIETLSGGPTPPHT